MIRETCGQLAGMLAHQAAGERLCGWCAYNDQVRRIAAEGVPARLTPPGWLPPVTAEPAEHHRMVLDHEVEQYHLAHAYESRRRDSKTRRLRTVA